MYELYLYLNFLTFIKKVTLPTQMQENFGSYQIVFEKNIGSFWLEPKAYFGSARLEPKKLTKYTGLARLELGFFWLVPPLLPPSLYPMIACMGRAKRANTGL